MKQSGVFLVSLFWLGLGIILAVFSAVVLFTDNSFADYRAFLPLSSIIFIPVAALAINSLYKTYCLKAEWQYKYDNLPKPEYIYKKNKSRYFCCIFLGIVSVSSWLILPFLCYCWSYLFLIKYHLMETPTFDRLKKEMKI